MRISDVARTAGCSVRAIRHLHETGAVPEPARTPGNYRDYTVRDLAAVLRARALIDAGVATTHIHSTDAIDRSLELIDAQIAHLTRQRERLTTLKAAPLGMPEDVRARLLEVLGDTDFLWGEIESFDLMALTGVATPATWDQLRANLANPDCVKATDEFAVAWEAGDVDKLAELLPRGIMRDLTGTLVPGDVPLTAGDTESPEIVEKLAGEFRD
ncbi:MerR family transcriptional regulator [Corynebacterium sp. MSK041]|uniref:MerR family transcriptional regulator n=1 Tax=Corynebacterium sp. MSK041 TaxID=3050194 RepID=UPI00254C3561|nr:MerR family transcriptional regulator [Corynebacterium sp. MSK041]MDK8795322.1 MerR family transcriptional regulator [Corynebacterium sp. MSK041]